MLNCGGSSLVGDIIAAIKVTVSPTITQDIGLKPKALRPASYLGYCLQKPAQLAKLTYRHKLFKLSRSVSSG